MNLLIHEIASKRLIELNILGRILRAIALLGCRSEDERGRGFGQCEFSQQSLLHETCYLKDDALAPVLESPQPPPTDVLQFHRRVPDSEIPYFIGALVLVGIFVPSPKLLVCSDAYTATPPGVDYMEGSLLCALHRSLLVEPSAFSLCADAARSRSDVGREGLVTGGRVIGCLLDSSAG